MQHIFSPLRSSLSLAFMLITISFFSAAHPAFADYGLRTMPPVAEAYVYVVRDAVHCLDVKCHAVLPSATQFSGSPAFHERSFQPHGIYLSAMIAGKSSADLLRPHLRE